MQQSAEKAICRSGREVPINTFVSLTHHILALPVSIDPPIEVAPFILPLR